MQTVITVTAAELKSDPSARLWALVKYLAERPDARDSTKLRSFWLAYSYDAEVLNGGHLQYFHNCGTDNVAETISALRAIGAHGQAALLETCWNMVIANPISRVDSLERYSSLAAERSFTTEDAAYYNERPEVMDLLEAYYAPMIAEHVAVSP